MARPAIRCFSTDLPPLGCDVVYQPVAPPIADMIVDAGCNTCSSLTHHARRFDLAPSGPCDCHVQDIACLGCGNVVGYYIHRPCFRCLAQRLRIKQRGFQHLWTFYQDNVLAVQREDEFGGPVGWDDLPTPPAPTTTVIRSSNTQQQQHVQVQVQVASGLESRSTRDVSVMVNTDSPSNAQPADVIESSMRDRYVRTFNDVARDLLDHSANASPSRRLAPSSGNTNNDIGTAAAARGSNAPLSAGVPATAAASQSQPASTSSAHRAVGRRASWLLFTSQRVAAERVLLNPRAGREARQEAMRTLATLREQEWSAPARASAGTSSPDSAVREDTMSTTLTPPPTFAGDRMHALMPATAEQRDASGSGSPNVIPPRPTTQTVTQPPSPPPQRILIRTRVSTATPANSESVSSSRGGTSSSSGARVSDGAASTVHLTTLSTSASSVSSSTSSSPSSSSFASQPYGNTPSAHRRDEAMEPLCPPKPKAVSAPPSGLSNWLFQVGLDCMVKWEEITLSR